jgi:hypothetical protein
LVPLGAADRALASDGGNPAAGDTRGAAAFCSASHFARSFAS